MSGCNHDKCLRDGCPSCCYCQRDLQVKGECGANEQDVSALIKQIQMRDVEIATFSSRIRSLEGALIQIECGGEQVDVDTVVHFDAEDMQRIAARALWPHALETKGDAK